MPDYSGIKQKQKSTWATGDFAIIGWNTVFPGELLCEAVDLRAGHKVLDVAAGSGNVALSAARRNCEAVGIDFVPGLIERARKRAEAEGLPVRFEVADCEKIPFPDASFDRVMSLYGSMFAPDQEAAASELVRVCRPGGKIGMGNWTPDGFWGQTFALLGRYLPPPEGVRPPPEWGTEKRLGNCLVLYRAASTSKNAARCFATGTTSTGSKCSVPGSGRSYMCLIPLTKKAERRLLRELNDILGRFNRSGDESLMVSADYLEVVIDI